VGENAKDAKKHCKSTHARSFFKHDPTKERQPNAVLGKSLSSTKSKEKDISLTIVLDTVFVFQISYPYFRACLPAIRLTIFRSSAESLSRHFSSRFTDLRASGRSRMLLPIIGCSFSPKPSLTLQRVQCKQNGPNERVFFSGSRQTTSYLRPIHWCGPSRRRLLSIYSLETSIFLTWQMDPSRQC